MGYICLLMCEFLFCVFYVILNIKNVGMKCDFIVLMIKFIFVDLIIFLLLLFIDKNWIELEIDL